MAVTEDPGRWEPRVFDAPRLPLARIAAIAKELIDNGRQVDAQAVARRLLVSAERQLSRDRSAAADRAALAMALLAEVRRRTRCPTTLVPDP